MSISVNPLPNQQYIYNMKMHPKVIQALNDTIGEDEEKSILLGTTSSYVGKGSMDDYLCRKYQFHLNSNYQSLLRTNHHVIHELLSTHYFISNAG